MRITSNRPHSRSEFPLALLWLGCILPVLGGCGSGSLSQRDLLSYGISRGGDDEDEADAVQAESAVSLEPVSPEPPVAQRPTPSAPLSDAAESPAQSSPSLADNTAGESASTPVDPRTAREPSTAAATASAGASAANGGSPTTPSVLSANRSIADRKPSQPLSDAQRRQRATENLESVSTAVIAWIEGSRYVPLNHIKNTRGRTVLSWRVQILPLLGYQELYDQFDLEQGWDSEHNQRLLEFIPDEYVSPERFDEHTNIQLLVNGQALFTEREQRDKSELSDAPNILMLAEVDDAMAVPWTAPFDYDTTEEPLSRGLGKLRSGGTFVAWMSGIVSVWPSPIREDILYKAITFEAGDFFPLANYQRYPEFNLTGDDRPLLGGASTASMTAATASRQSAAATLRDPDSPLPARMPLPDRELILEAEQKVRATYLTDFQRAQTAPELSKLATTIFQQITSGATPPADLFVGLRTALNIAIRARDPNLAMKIVDELGLRLDVKRTDFESIMLDGFLGDNGTLKTDASKAARLLPLAERLIEVDVKQNDFHAAEAKMNNARMILRMVNDRETQYRWKVLRERVDEGKRMFPRIATHLKTLETAPTDPLALKAVGWFLCSVKDTWPQGLELLAKSADDDLRELAQLEVLAESSVGAHIKLADAWWEYAVENRDDVLAFDASMERARKWYLSSSLALPDGLDRYRADNRLKEIDRMIGEMPDSTGVPDRSF